MKEGSKLTEKDEVCVINVLRIQTSPKPLFTIFLAFQAIVRNIQACRELTEKIRTSMGPLGMSKVRTYKNNFRALYIEDYISDNGLAF